MPPALTNVNFVLLELITTKLARAVCRRVYRVKLAGINMKWANPRVSSVLWDNTAPIWLCHPSRVLPEHTMERSIRLNASIAQRAGIKTRRVLPCASNALWDTIVTMQLCHLSLVLLESTTIKLARSTRRCVYCVMWAGIKTRRVLPSASNALWDIIVTIRLCRLSLVLLELIATRPARRRVHRVTRGVFKTGMAKHSVNHALPDGTTLRLGKQIQNATEPAMN